MSAETGYWAQGVRPLGMMEESPLAAYAEASSLVNLHTKVRKRKCRQAKGEKTGKCGGRKDEDMRG